VTLGGEVRRLVAGEPEGHDEGEVVEELEGRGGPIFLVRVPARHGQDTVSDTPRHPTP
jgi:hypothetical protein